MSNIREDKGLTYGIHSGLYPLKHTGYWAIYTDTNNKTRDICLREIYAELERLSNEPITPEEIKLARNYILGKYLSRTDGPFNRMETFKSYFIEEVPISSFQQYVEDIKAADALSLQKLAQQYLAADSMYEIVAG
jgi:predicted Zn-dependent peptidase